MVKKMLNAIWEFLVAIAEAKQARLKQQGYSSWY